jgi:hypothetical protein
MIDRSRLCLATSYTADFADIGGYCAMALHLYAIRHGYAVHVVSDLKTERPPAWHRVQLIPALFDLGYEFVLWTDADTVILRQDKDILSEVRPGKDLYLVEHTHPAFPTSKVPNTGVMLVRNTAWSRNFFERVWSMTEYRDHNWWENAAVIDLLGYRNLLGTGRYEPDCEIVSRVQFLDESWNHHPELSPPGAAIIRHYAGINNSLRRQHMPQDAAVAAYAALGLPKALSDEYASQRDAAAKLASILASRSWRITAPLRRLASLLRVR